jgi:hypothetical protein
MNNLEIIFKNDKVVSFMIKNESINYTVILTNKFYVYYLHPFESFCSCDEKISIAEIYKDIQR